MIEYVQRLLAVTPNTIGLAYTYGPAQYHAPNNRHISLDVLLTHIPYERGESGDPALKRVYKHHQTGTVWMQVYLVRQRPNYERFYFKFFVYCKFIRRAWKCTKPPKNTRFESPKVKKSGEGALCPHRPFSLIATRIATVSVVLKCLLYVQTNHLRDTKRHLPHWITLCYLSSDTSELALPKTSQAGWYSIYLPRRDGRLSWPRMDGYALTWFTCQQTVTHPSSNRARCRATSLIETNAATHVDIRPYRNGCRSLWQFRVDMRQTT